MPAAVLPADKPKIAFYGAMMAIQNFGFFLMYYQIFLVIPVSTPGVVDCARPASLLNDELWVSGVILCLARLLFLLTRTSLD